MSIESNKQQDALPADPPNEPQAPKDENLDQNHLKDESLLRHRTSFVWDYMPNENPQHIYRNTQNSVEWRCAYCSRRYRESRQERKKRTRGAIESAMDAVARSGGYKRRRLKEDEVKAEYITDPHVLELLIVRWFTSDSIPLSTVESEEFRAVMAYINRDIGAWLPSSGNTIKTWIIRHFVEERAKKISAIAKARSLIHISCDMAVSTNGLPIMVWISHFIDEYGDLEVFPLAVREI